jgi:hypothetical protein
MFFTAGGELNNEVVTRVVLSGNVAGLDDEELLIYAKRKFSWAKDLAVNSNDSRWLNLKHERNVRTRYQGEDFTLGRPVAGRHPEPIGNGFAREHLIAMYEYIHDRPYSPR